MFNPFKKKSSPRARASTSKDTRSSLPVAGKEEKRESVREVAKGERRIIGVIVAPHLTEKVTSGSAKRWYAFRVLTSATKPLVKAAVEDRYRVKVERVHIIPVRPKSVRIGRREGRGKGFKKALVQLSEGQVIDSS